MKGGIGNLMKQAQLVQENMKKLQEQLAVMEIEGQAGSGMVKVVMTGRHEVKRVTLDPRAPVDDREMLEDLITAAVNDAVRKIEATTQEKMAAATAGLPLPPGMKLPF
jgi:DNA-binding YbaB/EbfC family protein